MNRRDPKRRKGGVELSAPMRRIGFGHMLNEIEQLKKLLEDKKNVLIVFGKDGKGDAISSALALAGFLEKQGKLVDIVSDGFVLPKQIKFLKNSEKIQNGFSHLQKFIITIDTEKTGLQELSYDLKEEKLRVFVTPKQGFLTREDIRTAQSDFKYDIIFVLDTPDLEALGKIYDSNTELFYKKPVINIDHSPANGRFGQINLIDITASSSAEVIFDVMQKWQTEAIDADIATALLAGMITKTNSFKTENTKPNTLTIASRLMHLGANRDHIVQNLYRTRAISTLKLWGQALSHLQYDKSIGLVWTTITRDDFTRAGAQEHELFEIIDELIASSPEAKIIALLHEHPTANEIHAILTTTRGGNALQLLAQFSPTGGEKTATCLIENATLKEAEEKVIESIRKTTSI